MKDTILGKILWWSQRDQHGVITDAKGNEYYFDRSVVKMNKRKKLDQDVMVLFAPGRCDGNLVAKNVSLPQSKSQDKYETIFEQQSRQLNLPLAN